MHPWCVRSFRGKSGGGKGKVDDNRIFGYHLLPLVPPPVTVIDSPAMDKERFQQMKRLNEQVEATRAMNETLNKFIAIMGNQEVARNVTPPPLVSLPHVTTTLQALQPSRVKPGAPSHFDGDRAQGRAFLTSCELYISLTQSDFVNKQVRIHWALSYFKGGHVASFTEHIVWQEMRSGKMCFTSWNDFTEEFASMFCPEDKVTTA
jgi:hypothetical protein